MGQSVKEMFAKATKRKAELAESQAKKIKQEEDICQHCKQKNNVAKQMDPPCNCRI